MTSLHTDYSHRGATHVAKESVVNPRQIVIRLADENPSKTRDDLFAAFRDELEVDESARRAVEWYFFVNMYEYHATSRNRKTPEQKSRNEAAKAAKIENIKRQIVEVVLLDLMLPNGKKLSDATFADCAKAGGFFAKIAKKGKPNQIVGKVMSEDDLRKLR